MQSLALLQVLLRRLLMSVLVQLVLWQTQRRVWAAQWGTQQQVLHIWLQIQHMQLDLQ
jgi:hypothetical protein